MLIESVVLRKALLFVVFMVLIIPFILLAQEEELPPEYALYLNETTLIAVGAVVGFVKMFKNLLPVGGLLAVILTIVISFIYGVIQYGMGENGIVNGLIIGGLAALSFFLTKRIGYAWNKNGDKFHASQLKK